jgi:hypothetical protein
VQEHGLSLSGPDAVAGAARVAEAGPVDRDEVHVIVRGRGRPVVLVHGNGTMAEDFAICGLIDRLAARYRVIAIDRPGFGYTGRPMTCTGRPSTVTNWPGGLRTTSVSCAEKAAATAFSVSRTVRFTDRTVALRVFPFDPSRQSRRRASRSLTRTTRQMTGQLTRSLESAAKSAAKAVSKAVTPRRATGRLGLRLGRPEHRQGDTASRRSGGSRADTTEF